MSVDFVVRGFVLIIGLIVVLAILALLAVGAPEIAQPIIAVGHLVIAVAGSVIGVGVIVWALVEDPDWALRDAIRLVALTIFLALVLGGFALFIALRRT